MPDPYRYFRIEAGEILEGLQKGLFELEQGAPAPNAVRRLLRLAHTLKGAARVVKHREMADAAHAIEDLLVPVRDTNVALGQEAIERVLGLLDSMRAHLKRLTEAEPSQPVAGSAPNAEPALIEESFRAVRPHVEELDSLGEGLGELGSRLGALGRIERSLGRARGLAELLSDQVAPRKTVQGGAAAAERLRSLADELSETLRTTEGELLSGLEQARRELGQVRDAAERLRLVPAELMWSTLERTLRDAAVRLGKRVLFEARGGDLRLEADVLALAERALLQAVKNAVAHGIEAESERTGAGKPASGRIEIEVVRRSGEVVFVCRDDGRGVDLSAVRRAAEKRGMAASELERLDENGLVALLLQGGMSTADSVNEVAGRGIGLDLAREVAEKLGGRVVVRSRPGQGTTFELSARPSISALAALIIEAGGQTAALPLDGVRGTFRRLPADILHTPGGQTIVVDGTVLPFVELSRLFGDQHGNAAGEKAMSLVLVEGEGRVAAIGVDRLVGIESVVARALPELLVVAPIVAGAALDGDGEPRMVLSPEGLVASAHAATPAARAPRAERLPILVVDDSLTTRMLEQSILESAGYRVELATSGEEALEKARLRQFALFLVDVEMPGMDGFAFIERTRADPALRDVPAMLVTSRASPEDMKRGRAVGASAHIEKSDFDQTDLLNRIQKLLAPT